MSELVSFTDVFQQALRGVRSDDVQLFYDYFDDLKRLARKHLHGKAKILPGESAVAHSALLSLICDVATQQIPLNDVDEFGCPMLWPLLLQYLERHCNKWNKFYRAKKRAGTVVVLEAVGDKAMSLDPADHRMDANEEVRFDTALEGLYAKLTAEEHRIVELRMQDRTLAKIATAIGRAEATVSNRLQHIRSVITSA